MSIEEAIKEVKKYEEIDTSILNSPEHCDVCNCNCGCHPCKHTGEPEQPYFPSSRK